MLYRLTIIPLTNAQCKHMDAIQRRMLRSVVGWIRLPDDEWADTMRRVNRRVERALKNFPVKQWTQQFADRQYNLATRFAREEDTWTTQSIRWDPLQQQDPHYIQVPHRTRGRPRRKWDDFLQQYTNENFMDEMWIDAASSRRGNMERGQFSTFLMQTTS